MEHQERPGKGLKYLEILAEQYPNIQSASNEIIKLNSILHLPKGTEHFMSDLHGEAEAFRHILNNASGSVREKVDLLYRNTLPDEERSALSTLIYYPEEKLEELFSEVKNPKEWYKITLNRLIEICRVVASKYTREKVRAALPPDFSYVIDELLHNAYDEPNRGVYYESIIDTIIEIDRAQPFIIALCDTIKRLVVDHLHIVGDIFDRGPRADVIMDSLMEHHSVDIQWGNHDILWMGAATGSRACIAVVLNNSITYNNLEVIETGYGISLRPLALFANEVYQNVDVSGFMPKLLGSDELRKKDLLLSARMHKAIAIIQFKLEGQIIQRHPEFKMDDRLLLDKIDRGAKSVCINGKNYPLKDIDFPTVDWKHPYELSEGELEVMKQLKSSFLHSEKMQSHIKFLYAKGSLYKCYNSNLLFHGCIPLNPDGSLMEFEIGGRKLKGKAFMDHADTLARRGYYAKPETPEKQFGKDFLWFLWCGRNSPLFGRDKIATFERLLISDQETWKEAKNPYYIYSHQEKTCVALLREFGLDENTGHIINGHVPVKTKDGESPVHANGTLVVIDGGFCRAYQPTTGIAGYTLVYNSYGMRLSAHEPFTGTEDAIRNNRDIFSTTDVFDPVVSRIRNSETDWGKEIMEKIEDLKYLLLAYRLGLVKEKLDEHF